MAKMAEGGGPTKVMDAASQAEANEAFSERNPYPGWMAVAFDVVAAGLLCGSGSGSGSSVCV